MLGKAQEVGMKNSDCTVLHIYNNREYAWEFQLSAAARKQTKRYMLGCAVALMAHALTAVGVDRRQWQRVIRLVSQTNISLLQILGQRRWCSVVRSLEPDCCGSCGFSAIPDHVCYRCRRTTFSPVAEIWRYDITLLVRFIRLFSHCYFLLVADRYKVQ